MTEKSPRLLVKRKEPPGWFCFNSVTLPENMKPGEQTYKNSIVTEITLIKCGTMHQGQLFTEDQFVTDFIHVGISNAQIQLYLGKISYFLWAHPNHQTFFPMFITILDQTI